MFLRLSRVIVRSTVKVSVYMSNIWSLLHLYKWIQINIIRTIIYLFIYKKNNIIILFDILQNDKREIGK